ncbi:protein of unknown function [Taphrina deformans PYCC 5710]|uniref:Mediator of RNA polymerase II transcription subunit 17 n=1 Tax=Taphrina deformans (strain PYCC 5710 / ATCC 11124 / CBS 356.35 / IMI 108563 / JCM 9778 / NBRC 8474) TaxID=1097556 RepID=R4XHR4_TAPDE|nr:protein of unknown function [Taphrina deformans PYCC 5710]|eukprot:CCG84058.1 protein of unknown function [Taphrina deformans PYCC 5710]
MDLDQAPSTEKLQNGATSLQLSLRSVANDDAFDTDEQSISAILHRIGRQRGSFRNFTEASLLEELEDPSRIVPDQTEQDTEVEIKDRLAADRTDEKPAPIKATDVEVRENVLQLTSSALNESALALDFASLLLSSNRVTAIQSMSPALKDAVPASSLSHTRVFRTPASRQNATTATLLGFKAQGLSNASLALSKASIATSDSQATDEIFWQEVQQLITAGWRLFRPKAGMAGLSVRFGAAYRHSIPLEKDNEGHIDSSKFDTKQVSLRFSLRRAGRTILTRANDVCHDDEDMDRIGPPIVRHLKRARRSLITSEVFDDLTKEARECANLGTSIIDRMITVPLGNGLESAIELVDTDDGEGGPSLAEDTEMKDQTDDSRDKDSNLLLCTLATIVYSRMSHSPRPHPLKRFLSSYRHGQTSAIISTKMKKLFGGLQCLSWPQIPSIECILAPVDVWDKSPTTTIDTTFLNTEIHISIVTTLRSITTYTINSANQRHSGITKTQRQLKTHDPVKVMDMIRFELNETIMSYLVSQNHSCMRCSEDQVRFSAGVVTVSMNGDGVIALYNGEGMKKVVERDLALEVADHSNYT